MLYCLEELKQYGYETSTVEPIKKMAYDVGWDGQKTPEARKALSELKKVFNEWLDLSYKEIKRKIRVIDSDATYYKINPNKFFLFVHSREPEEIARFVKDFNAITVFIDRAQNNVEYSNSSDQNVEDYEYDFIISNDGSLEDLRHMAKVFLTRIKNERGIK